MDVTITVPPLAFEEAKNRSVSRLRDLTAAHVPVPWHSYLVQRAGDDAAIVAIEPSRRSCRNCSIIHLPHI
jgi:hypothetical protein